MCKAAFILPSPRSAAPYIHAKLIDSVAQRRRRPAEVNRVNLDQTRRSASDRIDLTIGGCD